MTARRQQGAARDGLRLRSFLGSLLAMGGLCLLLNGTLAAQTVPSLTPTLPLPNNPTVQEPVRVIPAQPANSVVPAKAMSAAAELPQWRGHAGS